MTEKIEQWQPAEFERETETPDVQHRRLLPLAIGVSVLLHGAVVAVFVLLGIEFEQAPPPPPDIVRVNFVPTNPQQIQPLPINAVAEQVVNTEPVDDPPIAPVEETNAEPVIEAESSSIADTLPTPDTMQPPQSVPDVPRITVPSLLSLQQTIQAVIAEGEARSWLFNCNPLEEEAGVRKCDSIDRTNYRVIERNSSYEALNPVREYSRTELSLRAVYQNTGAVERALDTAAIPEDLSNYLRSELEAGTSVYSDNATSTGRQQRRLIDRSAAAQQIERTLGDPWVRGKAAEVVLRKVDQN